MTGHARRSRASLKASAAVMRRQPWSLSWFAARITRGRRRDALSSLHHFASGLSKRDVLEICGIFIGMFEFQAPQTKR
jgi:hypothetical protein